MGHWNAVQRKKKFYFLMWKVLLVAEKKGVVDFKQEKWKKNKRKPKINK